MGYAAFIADKENNELIPVVAPPLPTDLINYPNLWAVNVELDFGNGVFGRRFKGAITAAANVVSAIVLFTQLQIDIFDSGGYCFVTAATKYFVNAIYIDGNTIYFLNLNYNINTGQLGLQSRSVSSRTNAPYDIWILYTKV